MPNKEEQQKRKQLLDELAKKQAQAFESSLPMSRTMFAELFEYLDLELGKQDCDDTLQLTEAFLVTKNISNAGAVKEWLEEHGGNCDCEVLGNVEEQLES